MTALFRRPLAFVAFAVALQAASAGEFSVSPIRVDLRPGGALSETITVTNHAKDKLRVGVRLLEWTQDAEGKDVYQESSDLVYFPRQLEIEAEGKRLVRLGMKAPVGATERAYRLFIEEQPEPSTDAARAQVAFYFRFGVPVFVASAAAKAQPEVMEPTVQGGKLSVLVKNPGSAHFRLTRVAVSDGAGFQKDIVGWYSLAGTQRTYSLELPREACRKAGAFSVALEGEGFRIDRKVNVDPASCS
jgi:fimbrial chaperone protein